MDRRSLNVAAQRAVALVSGPDRHRHLPGCMQVADLDREALRRMQMRRLRDLLEHAGRTVPYWRDLFRRLEFDPRSVRAPEDLGALPVLDRETIRSQGRRMVSEVHDPRGLVERRTGGSTGEPLVFHASMRDMERQMAINVRGFVLAGVHPGDPVANVWGYGRLRIAPNLLAPLTGRLELDSRGAGPERMDRWLAALRLHRPVMLYGYAGALAELADHVQRRGARIPGLEAVCSTAEKLFPEQRERIARATGARVHDMYGCHEVIRLASQCREGGMHVAPDAAVLEFVPGSGDPDSPRRILLTSLVSRAMPFIRYDVGDAGRPLPGACPCGLAFPLMSIDVGKVHHVFALPGGRRLHTTAINGPLFRLDAVRAYQIRHVTLPQVEILAVPRPGLEREAHDGLAAAVRTIQRSLGDGVRLTTRLVDAIPPSPGGKRPLVVSLVPEDT